MLPLHAAGQAMAHHLPPGMEEVDEFAEPTFADALAHPLGGADHWMAAVAVGLIAASWGRKTGGRSAALFLAGMAGGMAAGRMGFQMPLMETALAASVLCLGAAVAGAQRVGARTMAGMAGLAGVLHGSAHGMEMPAAASSWSYGAGLILTSAAITAAAAMTSFLTRQSGDFLATDSAHSADSAHSLASHRAPFITALPRWAGASLAAAGAWLLITRLAAA